MDNLKIIGSICKSLKDSIPTQCKNDKKREKTVGVEGNDVSETTVTIAEAELSDNSNNKILAWLTVNLAGFWPQNTPTRWV